MANSVLAVIPARGGSKRIPHKNIKDFLGKPLIAYSIENCLKSGICTDVIVSTDDEEIAAVARQYGASVPFMRDAALANDYAGTAVVALDAYRKMTERGGHYDTILTVYATAPLLTPEYLQAAYAKFSADHADYIFACCEFPFPVQRGFYQSPEGAPIAIMPECQMMRSQDLPRSFQDAGQFYFHSPKLLEATHGAMLDGTATEPNRSRAAEFTYRMFEMPRYRVIDIDTPEDWEYALILAEAIKKLGKS